MAALLCMHISSPGVSSSSSYFPASQAEAVRSACLAQEKIKVLHCNKVKEDKDLTLALKAQIKERHKQNKKTKQNKKITKHNTRGY